MCCPVNADVDTHSSSPCDPMIGCVCRQEWGAAGRDCAQHVYKALRHTDVCVLMTISAQMNKRVGDYQRSPIWGRVLLSPTNWKAWLDLEAHPGKICGASCPRDLASSWKLSESV